MSAVEFGLVSVMIMSVETPGSIKPELKLFAMVGGDIAVSVAEAPVASVPALVVVMLPVLFV